MRILTHHTRHRGLVFFALVLLGMAFLSSDASTIFAQVNYPSEECIKGWKIAERAYDNLSASVHRELYSTNTKADSQLDFEVKLLDGMRCFQVTDLDQLPPVVYVRVQRQDAYFHLLRQGEIWKPEKLYRTVKAPLEVSFFCDELVEGFSHYGLPMTKGLELSLINPLRFEKMDEDRYEYEFARSVSPEVRWTWTLRPSLGWMAEEKAFVREKDGKTVRGSQSLQYEGSLRGVPRISQVLEQFDGGSKMTSVLIDDRKPLADFFHLTHYGLSESLLGPAPPSPRQGYVWVLLFAVGLIVVVLGVYIYRKARTRA